MTLGPHLTVLSRPMAFSISSNRFKRICGNQWVSNRTTPLINHSGSSNPTGWVEYQEETFRIVWPGTVPIRDRALRQFFFSLPGWILIPQRPNGKTSKAGLIQPQNGFFQSFFRNGQRNPEIALTRIPEAVSRGSHNTGFFQ
jgi:hypothetical protein